MYLMRCVVFIIIFDYISADSKVITEVSFNISINNIPTCINNPVRGLVTAQQRFRVSAVSKDKEFATNVTRCFFNNTKQNPIRLKPEDDKHLFVTSDELYFKPEMDGHQLICELGLNMSKNPDNNHNRTLNRSYSTAKCVMSIHLEITKVSFNISMKGNIPTCTINPIRGPVIAQQKFRVSATSEDKLFAPVTTCFFTNSTHNNTRNIRLKPKDENNLFVESDELYFKPEMDGRQLVCELGLNIERNRNIDNNWTLDSHDRRNSTARCVMSIHLDNQTGTGASIANNELDYKKLMIIGFSLASVFLMICLAQSVALCICVTKGRFRKKKGERTNTDSIISDSGTVYEELKPIPQDIETLTVDVNDKHPGKCLTIDSPRPENNGKKGIMAIFARSPKSHPPPVTESTQNIPDPPRSENKVKKGIMARFAKCPKSHPPPVTETTLNLPDPPRPENNGKKGNMARLAKSPEYHPSPLHKSTLNLPGFNTSSARPHVFQEEIYSNEYVPDPTLIEIPAPPRPPKPNHQLKPPVAKKLIRQQKFEGNSPTPVVSSSNRISEMVSKLEGNLKPAVAHGVPVTSVLKPKGRVVASEHVPVQHAWSPPPRTPVIPTQHHLEDERMDSEDSEDWTYEDLEEIYEMPEP